MSAWTRRRGGLIIADILRTWGEGGSIFCNFVRTSFMNSPLPIFKSPIYKNFTSCYQDSISWQANNVASSSKSIKSTLKSALANLKCSMLMSVVSNHSTIMIPSICAIKNDKLNQAHGSRKLEAGKFFRKRKHSNEESWKQTRKRKLLEELEVVVAQPGKKKFKTKFKKEC